MLRRRTRHRHAHPARLAASLVALAALAGCGGEDDDQEFAPGVARPAERVSFIADADRICGSTNARVEAAADDLVSTGDQPPPAEVRRIVLSVVVPTLQTEVRAIRALPVPAGDEEEIARILEATQDGIAEINADPESVLDGPPPGLRRAGRLARAYGSRDCGVPSG